MKTKVTYLKYNDLQSLMQEAEKCFKYLIDIEYCIGKADLSFYDFSKN